MQIFPAARSSLGYSMRHHQYDLPGTGKKIKPLGKVEKCFFFFLGVVKTKNRSPFMANQIEIKRGYIYIQSIS